MEASLTITEVTPSLVCMLQESNSERRSLTLLSGEPEGESEVELAAGRVLASVVAMPQ